MFIEQYLVRERNQERIKRAEQQRTGQRIMEFRKLEKQRKRAERQLLQAWRRVDQLHSITGTN